MYTCIARFLNKILFKSNQIEIIDTVDSRYLEVEETL